MCEMEAMTTKELAQTAGVSERTIRRIAEQEVGIVFQRGKKALYDEQDAIEILRKARKKGFIQPRQNAEVTRQSADVVTKQDLALFGASIVSEMMKQFLPLIQNRQPLMIEQDYYSITGYANKIGQKISFSEALVIGKTAGRISREIGKEIRRVDDERWGQVNSYHVDVLKEVFQI
jgi:DeoR/GlpR family transcriptional regulator of sugar metabolism